MTKSLSKPRRSAAERDCKLPPNSGLGRGEEQLHEALIISNRSGFAQELFFKGADVTCRWAWKAKNFALKAMPADLQPPLKGKSCRFRKIGFPL